MPFLASRIAEVAKATSAPTRCSVARARISPTVVMSRCAASSGSSIDGNAASASLRTARRSSSGVNVPSAHPSTTERWAVLEPMSRTPSRMLVSC